MGRFKKKPVEIEARQFKGKPEELHDIYLWLEENIGSVDPYGTENGVTIRPDDGKMIIRTLEGDMAADLGDWIIKGVKGEFYPFKPDIFAATYEEVL